MKIKGVLFDLYGTLIDIETDESREDIYRSISHFLTYQGILIHRGELRDRYFRLMREHKEQSAEDYPEVNVETIWDTFLKEYGITPPRRRKSLNRTLALLHRGISRKRLQLNPEVKNVLDQMRSRYRLGIVSDAQPLYALPEIRVLGLHGYFKPIVLSAHYGFRKPDPRLFYQALEIMRLSSSEVIFVGNDMYRDVYGSTRAGMKNIFIVSTQGEQAYKNTTADYVANQFEDVLCGIQALTD